MVAIYRQVDLQPSVGEMPLHQLSVFVENKPGCMARVLAALENGFRVFALSIAEAGEFGLIRLIVSEPEKAADTLESAGFHLAKARKNVEVVGVLLTNEMKLSKIAKHLSDNAINIDYTYCTSSFIDGCLALILRTDDPKRAEDILASNGARILTRDDLS